MTLTMDRPAGAVLDCPASTYAPASAPDTMPDVTPEIAPEIVPGEARTPLQRIADAIRRGAALRPQCRGGYFTYTHGLPGSVSSCALGALYEATHGYVPFNQYGPERTALDVHKLIGGYGVPPHAGYRHPVDGMFTTLSSLIVDLNDNRGWTREQIADAVETLHKFPAETYL